MSISSTIVDRADIQFHAAPPALKEHVGCFWIIKAEHGATMRVVPDGTTTIAIKQYEDGRFEGYLRGPSLQPNDLSIAPSTTLIGVRLRPGVAHNLSSLAIHTLVDQRACLRDHKEFLELTSPKPVPLTPLQWVAKLQQFLISRLAGSSVHPLVTKVLDDIHAEHGSVSVAEVAARHGVSERHLTRLMRDWIGFGTKRYASIVRFQSTLEQMESAREVPAAVLATDAGYFDQSHFNVDVARYAGATPGNLITEHVSDFSKTHCDVPY
jgi:AraC-like DNA-binding protein